jgi:HSP20 family molecular chaperone IbpA
MKLRISGNSVRLRLKPSEVEQLAGTGLVEDRVEFAPDSELVYSLHASPKSAVPTASYTDGKLEIRIPQTTARQWAAGSDVSIEARQDVLAILIEKDFRCAHQGAGDSDVYPNPALR